MNRLLCAVDFSECSRHALAYAAAIARWYESELTALHVFSDRPLVDIIPSLGARPMTPPARAGAERIRQIEDHLRRFVDGLKAKDVDIAVSVVEAPDIRQEILVQADRLRADLVVLGTHGRSGVDHLILGSVAEFVLRKAAHPIMVVPTRIEPPVAGVIHFKRILCAIDFSESSLTALGYAMELAEQSDAELRLLHVIEMAPELVEAAVAAHFDLAHVRAKAEATIRQRLEAMVPDSVRAYCTVRTTVSEGRAATEILRAATEDRSDVIIMGVHGRGALDLAVFGSKTHEVVRNAPCPVLTVRGGR